MRSNISIGSPAASGVSTRRRRNATSPPALRGSMPKSRGCARRSSSHWARRPSSRCPRPGWASPRHEVSRFGTARALILSPPIIPRRCCGRRVRSSGRSCGAPSPKTSCAPLTCFAAIDRLAAVVGIRRRRESIFSDTNLFPSTASWRMGNPSSERNRVFPCSPRQSIRGSIGHRRCAPALRRSSGISATSPAIISSSRSSRHSGPESDWPSCSPRRSSLPYCSPPRGWRLSRGGIVWATATGVSWVAALAVAATLNLVAAGVLVVWVRGAAGELLFAATLRQLRQEINAMEEAHEPGADLGRADRHR